MPKNSYLTTKQVALKLDIPHWTVWRLARRHGIEPERMHEKMFLWTPEKVKELRAALKAERSPA